MFTTGDLDDELLYFGATGVVRNPPWVSEDHRSIDYYYWFQATAALEEFGGPRSPARFRKFYDPWQKSVAKAVLSLQDRTEGACSRGGWLVSDRWGSYSGAGSLYNTAMCVLTLEIFFRY